MPRKWCFVSICLLSHHHIKHHHQHKAYGETYGAEVAVLAALCFGYELFHYHVEHGACCKGEHVG